MISKASSLLYAKLLQNTILLHKRFAVLCCQHIIWGFQKQSGLTQNEIREIFYRIENAINFMYMYSVYTFTKHVKI